MFLSLRNTQLLTLMGNLHIQTESFAPGEKLGSLTLICLLCHLCCGEFTTNNKAASEQAVAGGKSVSSHFTTNLAEVTH